MKSHIELVDQAFAVLESLPEITAFDLFSKLDKLAQFPQMGSPLGPRFPDLEGFRQLVYKRRLRIIYEFDEHDNIVYVLVIQNCKQKLPAPRELKRNMPKR